MAHPFEALRAYQRLRLGNQSSDPGEIMAHAGEAIENPRTGQRMVFLQTGADTSGELLRIECFNPATGVDEPEHCHPLEESPAEVMSPALRFRVRGEIQDVGPGGSLHA